MNFNLKWDNEDAQAFGNETWWKFLRRIETTKQDAKTNDKTIVKLLENFYPDIPFYNIQTTYSYLLDSNLLKDMINSVDQVYFNQQMLHLGVLNKIDVQFHDLQSGIAGSTAVMKDRALIKINLMQFLAWENVRKGSRMQSMGTERCSGFIECILKSFLHELTHAIIIVCSPIIKLNKVIVRPRHFVNEWKYTRVPQTVGDLNYKGDTFNANTGHGSVFMNILFNTFGQKFDYHDNYRFHLKL
jgi:hypothetical protein